MAIAHRKYKERDNEETHGKGRYCFGEPKPDCEEEQEQYIYLRIGERSFLEKECQTHRNGK